MSAKENLNEAMFTMFGLGKAPGGEKKAVQETAAVKTDRTTEQSARPEQPVTYLAPGSVMEGALKSAGDVKIAGDFNGNITAAGKVTLRSNVKGNITAANLQISGCRLVGDVHVTGMVMLDAEASIKGKIIAGDLICAGYIQGDLDVKGNVSLKANATVEGNITTASMTMEQGTAINGGLTMKNGKTAGQHGEKKENENKKKDSENK